MPLACGINRAYSGYGPAIMPLISSKPGALAERTVRDRRSITVSGLTWHSSLCRTVVVNAGTIRVRSVEKGAQAEAEQQRIQGPFAQTSRIDARIRKRSWFSLSWFNNMV